MTKFEALKVIAQGAGLTVADVCSEPNIDLKNALVDEALRKIAETVRQVLPKRSPLELPLGVTLTRFFSPKEVLFVGTRKTKDVKGNEVKKLCRVVVDMDAKMAVAYYNGKLIGCARTEKCCRHFLERAGIGVLRAYLAVAAHRKENRDRKAAAKKGGR